MRAILITIVLALLLPTAAIAGDYDPPACKPGDALNLCLPKDPVTAAQDPISNRTDPLPAPKDPPCSYSDWHLTCKLY